MVNEGETSNTTKMSTTAAVVSFVAEDRRCGRLGLNADTGRFAKGVPSSVRKCAHCAYKGAALVSRWTTSRIYATQFVTMNVVDRLSTTEGGEGRRYIAMHEAIVYVCD